MSSLGLGGGGSFTPLGKGLAVALVAGSLGAALSPRFLAAAGLVSARAISRPWTLVTCAFVGSPATVSKGAVGGCQRLNHRAACLGQGSTAADTLCSLPSPQHNTQALPYAVAALFLARIVEPLQGARGLAKYLGATLAAASGVTVAIVTVRWLQRARLAACSREPAWQRACVCSSLLPPPSWVSQLPRPRCQPTPSLCPM